MPSFEGTDCLLATGVLSLSVVSADLDGVAGTFNGWAEGVLDISNLKETRTSESYSIHLLDPAFPNMRKQLMMITTFNSGAHTAI